MSNKVKITNIDGSGRLLTCFNSAYPETYSFPDIKRVIDLKVTAQDGANSVIVLSSLKIVEEDGLPVILPGIILSEVRCQEKASHLKELFADAGLKVPEIIVPFTARLKSAASKISGARRLVLVRCPARPEVSQSNIPDHTRPPSI